MSDSEGFVLERFRKSVESLVESVKEMLAASRLIRGRIEGNDELLLRIENTQRTFVDRLDSIERRQNLIAQRLTKIEGAVGDFPSSIP